VSEDDDEVKDVGKYTKGEREDTEGISPPSSTNTG